MNATRRQAAEPGTGRSGNDAAIRGALLVAVAVIIGLLLLWRGHDDDTSTVSAGNGNGDTPVVTEAPDDSTTDSSVPDDSTPPPSTHAPAEVQVLVANGTGTDGGAGAVTNKLIPHAYATLPAANASGQVATSVVYYREGYQEDARQIAILLGVPEETAASIVQPMPDVPPVAGDRGQQSAQAAQVLVVLGTDGVIPQT